MPFQSSAFTSASSKPMLFVFVPILVNLLSHGTVVEADNKTTNIGVIIDVNSRIGKEQKTAMNIAVQNFNNSTNHNLCLHFRSSGGDPLQAAYAAEQLIKEKQVQVIIGMETCAEIALVAKIGNDAQVPVISLTAGAGATKMSQWPFLIQMVTNVSEQMDCTTAIIDFFNWRKVTVVYEEDPFAGDSRMLVLLSDALRNVGSDIEYHLVIPPFPSLSHPQEFVREQLMKLNSTQPRAYIIFHSSLPLTSLLFSEAKKMGFMGKGSAWVISDTVASFLDFANSSFMSSMEGVFGIKIDYFENTTSFLDFKQQFQLSFQLEYPEEDNFNPGIHGLRAYDSIATIIGALDRLTDNTNTSTSFLEKVLSSNFTGLSGEIHFEDGRLSYQPIYRVINVLNLTYNKLGYCSPNFGLSLNIEESGMDSNGKGNLKRVLKEWAVPSLKDPLLIGVPGRAAFDNFVRITTSAKNSSEKIYSGFCISVFQEVRRILDYDLPYKFVEFNGTYDDLVGNVANKTLDGAVGDITILAERWKDVEFTQPITESGLSMVVQIKPASKAWIFLYPFTIEMWLATGAILIYTMFVVWFFEHRSNPEFNGLWKDQLGNVLWFTFSSLFLVHREKIQSNYTRVVVVVWLFVALILTQSFTANLTSTLTISRLQPNIESMNKVGCDANAFMSTYVHDVLKYKPENVKLIRDQDEYLKAFENGSISAAFLEIPYAKVFVNNHCMKYTVIGSTYRFGGFGFVFQNGSPIAADVSKAILQLSEDGSLKRMEENLLTPSSECLDSQNTKNIDSLSLESFWGLYLFSIATSSICFLIFVAHLLKNYKHHQSRVGDIHGSDESVWNKTRKLARYLSDAEIETQRKDTTSGQATPSN